MLKKITFWVVAVHLVWVANLMFSFKKKSPSFKKFVVQTEKLKPSSIPKGDVVSHSAPASKAKPKKQPPKKEAAPAAVARKKPSPPIAKPKGLITQAPDKVSSKVKKAQKDSLKKEEKQIEKDPPPIEKELEVPTTIGILNLEKSNQEEQEGGTEDILVSYLRSALHLPEYGEVKIQLTILSDGSFVKMVVLKSESVKNEKYLEIKLPLLTFPFVRGTFLGERTFIMTFCNEI